ncbi:MAG: D-alanine--(R)-lactate ligase [Nocardioides sp.]|nr:D-alanine--(R)-lactate ligase [Nocardioides sp.]
MDKLRVGIVFGGAGEEHPVSVKSATEVAKHLDTAKYEPSWIGITKNGEWRLCDAPGADWEDRPTRPAVLSPDRGNHGLLVPGQDGCETVRLDVLLPVLHGKLGEDGAIQGLFELSGIPYVGCDIAASALCMDKSLTYLVARAAGVATPRFWTITGDEPVDASGFTFPVFVKPARSGSSFGVTKVSHATDLPDAIKTAQQYDAKVLVEEAVIGEEIGTSILGVGDDLVTGEADRVALTHGFFKIHQEDKPEQGSENASFIVPADISAKARDRVLETAKVLYRAMGCRGLARVDLFLKDDGSVVLNEINTLPGLTSYSRYPRMMAAAGMPLSDVLDRTISLALAGAEDAR